MERAVSITNRLLAQAQALSGVTAYLQLKGLRSSEDSELHARLEDVVDVLGAREALDELSAQEREIVVSTARSYLHQALELADHPGRENAWTHDDPAILQAQGAASMVVADLIAACGLGGSGVRILDVGTGVAKLAIAFTRRFPASSVVGIDPWAPALRLARENVREAGLESRITLSDQPVQEFDDAAGFDLVWLPSFFIPANVLDAALRNVRRMLRTGGALVVGIREGPEDPLAGAVDAMVTVRSGGAVLDPEGVIARLQRAGFSEAREARRTWKTPLRLVIVRQA